MKALVIKADETQELIDLPEKDSGLAALQGAVGGYIEAILYTDGWVMFANEEGNLRGLPWNPKASALILAVCEASNHPAPRGSDRLVGDVVIVGHDGGPDNVEIPEEWVEQFKALGLWV